MTMKSNRFFRSEGDKWKLATFVLAVLVVAGSTLYICRYEPFSAKIEVTNELGGNIFPVTILSTATTDANLIVPAGDRCLGNPKSCIALRVKSTHSFLFAFRFRVYTSGSRQRIHGVSGHYLELQGFA